MERLGPRQGRALLSLSFKILQLMPMSRLATRCVIMHDQQLILTESDSDSWEIAIVIPRPHLQLFLGCSARAVKEE